MATQPDTQPVPTPAPALSTVNIRETLNPAPPEGAPRAVVAEWGYIEAMLDGLLADYDDGELDPETFVGIVREALYYDGCEWHRLEWDEAGLTNLQSMADVIVESDYDI